MGGKTWTSEELAALGTLSWEQFHERWPKRTYFGWSQKRYREEKGCHPAAKQPAQGEPEEFINSAPTAQAMLQDAVLEALKKGPPKTVVELAEAVDRSPGTVREIVEILKGQGYEISVREDEERVALDRQHRATDLVVDLTPYYGERLRLMIISCTHYGNRYRQHEALVKAYGIAEREKIDAVLHCGDLTDGFGMYKGQEFDQYALGADAQVAATVEEYPRSGIRTMVLGGNHDYSFQKRSGTNVVKRICAERPDLEYCGMLAANFTLGDQVRIRVMHARGGVPYARSYRGQKSNEAMGRGEHVPQVFCIGGLHVVDYVPYLNVHTFLAGCFEGQTPYLQEKGLFPDIGAWVAMMNLGDDGRLNRCTLEWLEFEEKQEFGDGYGQGVGRRS